MAKLNGKDPNEVSVWHGTSKLDPRMIYEDRQDGYMVQYSSKGMWGNGIYFAQNASYSDGYAFSCAGGRYKCFMLTKLLSGEEIKVMHATQ